MPKKPKLRLLSIFLLRESVDDFEGALKPNSEVNAQPILQASGVRGLVVVKQPSRRQPGWTSFIAPHVADRNQIENLTNVHSRRTATCNS